VVAELPTEFEIIDILFIAWYVIELALKIVVHKLFFFCNDEYRWNIFDFGLVVISIFDLMMTRLLNVAFMRALRILKLTKILRVFRLMRVMQELRMIMDSLIGCASSLFWSTVMMTLIFFMFGICFVQGVTNYLANDENQNVEISVRDDLLRHWGSVQGAMLSLFKSSMGGDDWSIFYSSLYSTGDFLAGIFLFFICFNHIALMNILTGLFVENAIKLAVPDPETQVELKLKEHRLKHRLERNQLKGLCEKLDLDGDMVIQPDQFVRMMNDQRFTSYFHGVLGLELRDAEDFYKLLQHSSDVEEEGVTIDAFVDFCMSCRGGAQNLDVQTLKFDLKDMRRLIITLSRQLQQRMEQKTALDFQI
jgi:hypothetical protein